MFGSVIMMSVFKERRFDAPHIVTALGFSDSNIETVALWGGRFTLLAYSLLASVLVFSWWTAKRFDLPGRFIVFGALAPCLALALCAVLGTNPEFAPPILVWPALFIAFWLLPTPPAEWWRGELCLAGRTLAVGSLLSLIVVPEWAADVGYAGIIPNFNFRLAGLTIHSNTLGPFMALALVAEFHAKPKWPAAVFIALELLTLALTQSKTSLAMAAVAIPLSLVSPHSVLSRLGPAVRVLVLAWFWSVAICLSILATSALNTRELNLTGVDTLSGRTLIWDAVLDVWKDNIFFGYGPRIWDEVMQQRLESSIGFRVYHSHNQFVEILGMSGIVGLLAWLGFLTALVVSVLRFAKPNRTECVCYLLVMLVGGISEPWFTTYGFIGGPWLLVVYSTLLVLCRQQQNAKSPVDGEANSNLSPI